MTERVTGMNTGKRWAAVFAAFLMLLAAGCAGNKTALAPAAEETSSAPEAETLKIGVCIYSFEDSFMTQYREELKQYLTETYGAEVTVLDSKKSQEEQNSQVERFLESGVDALILNLVDSEAAGSLVESCKASSVPVVFINRRPQSDQMEKWEKEGAAAVYVGTDARQSGTYQGEIVLETPNRGDFNGDGVVNYVMITGSDGNEDAKYRTEYSIKALKDAGLKVNRLTERSGNWNEKEGYQLVFNALFQYGREIEVIFCNNDAMANGARVALKEAGRTAGRDVCLVGVDALRETVGYVKDGTITGTVLNDYTSQAHTAADAAVKMINGEKTEREYLIDYVKVVGDLSRCTIGFCVPVSKEQEDLLYRDKVVDKLARGYNAEVEIAEVKGDWESMVKEINGFARKKADAVIIDISQVTEPERLEKKCRSVGISALFVRGREELPESGAESLEEAVTQSGQTAETATETGTAESLTESAGSEPEQETETETMAEAPEKTEGEMESEENPEDGVDGLADKTAEKVMELTERRSPAVLYMGR